MWRIIALSGIGPKSEHAVEETSSAESLAKTAREHKLVFLETYPGNIYSYLIYLVLDANENHIG